MSRGVFVIPWKEVQTQDYTIFDALVNELGRLGYLKKNDIAVFTAGIPTSRKSGTSNTVALRKFGVIE